MIRARAAFWLVGFVALIAIGFPSAVQAHGSYGHHVHAAHGHASQAHAADLDVSERRDPHGSASHGAHRSVKGEATATAASVSPSGPVAPVPGSGCKDHGCCMAGHCATCVAVIISGDGDVWLPARPAGFGWHRAAAIAAATPHPLKRPPKS